MNLQTQYDLDTAKIIERNTQRETFAVTIFQFTQNVICRYMTEDERLL